MMTASPPPASGEAGFAPEKVQNIEDYRLEDLEAISNYGALLLQTLVDAQVARRKIPRLLKCDPSTNELNQWMMQIKGLMDPKILVAQEKYLQEDPILRTQKSTWLQCEQNCLCGLYAEIIEGLPTERIQDRDQKLAEILRSKKEKESIQQAQKCARKLDWFCKSVLRSYLRK